jgi:Fe-S oxidoreductase
MDVPHDQAVQWWQQMMEGRPTPVLERCITCYACNEVCPEQANPFDLIAALQESHGVLIPRDTIRETEARYVFTGDLQGVPRAERVLSTCVFGKTDPNLMQGELYDLPRVGGRPFFCWVLFSHMCAESVQRNHAAELVARLASTGAREIVCFHDDCYAMLAKLAPDYGIPVPFRPVHLSEHLVRRLHARRERIRPLNLDIAYQRPCASRHTPEKEPWIDELFDLAGVRRVERTYDRKGALCCGGVKLFLGIGDPAPDQEKNLCDAKQAGARALVCLCPMCMRSLAGTAARHGLPVLFLGDIARMALGEIPAWA